MISPSSLWPGVLIRVWLSVCVMEVCFLVKCLDLLCILISSSVAMRVPPEM